METSTMFSRFSPLAVIRASQDRRAVQNGGRMRRGRRPFDWTRSRARFQLEGLEERCLLSGISGISEFQNGGLGSDFQSPRQIAAGPDGNLWFTPTGEAIATINPTTHAITGFILPDNNNDFAEAVAAGPDGNVWFTQFDGRVGDEIGMINPTTHAITEFPVHSPGSSDWANSGITAGPDGNMWFTDPYANAIGMINPTTHAITEFTLPTANAGPRGITAGPDGNLWFTEGSVSQVGEINPTTHTIAEFATPTANSAPFEITAGSDGNLWFTERGVGQVAKINPTTHVISEFATPSGALALGITEGPDGNLWFTENAVGKLGEINPTTDVITEYSVPYTNAGPQGITAGPDGNLWFADTETDAIGVATLAPTQLVVTQQPPTSVTAGSPFGLTVEDVDSSGNLVSSFNGTVTVGLLNPPAGATIGGTVSVTASNGVATFSNVSLTKAASSYTLVVTSSGVGEAVPTAVTVTPAPASQVAITQQPQASVTAGNGFGLLAAIEDPYGNVVTSASNTVTVALANNPGGSSLGGTLSVTASQGVAAFGGLTLTKAASGYTLQVSSSGLSSAISSAITVTPAAATQVVITQQPPASVPVNTGFGLQAAIEDAYGNVETSASNTVKVAMANNPTGAKLGGTLSLKATNGVSTFSGLTINKVGTGYTLQVSSSGLSSATTGPIAVTNTAAIILPSTGTTAGAIAPDPFLAPLVLDSPDFLDSLGLKKRARLT
jgi:streptogramin lyase